MPPFKTKHSFLKTGTVVFILLVSAKALNLFKKILVGKIFGISWQADAFFAASYLPYYAAVFFEGVIYLGFMPLFSRVMSEKGEQSAYEWVRQLLPWILFLTGALALASWYFAPWLTHELVPGFLPERRELTIGLLRIMAWVLIFIPLSSFFQAINSYLGHYQLAASTGLIDTLMMIVFMLCGLRWFGIQAAAWGAVLGAVSASSFQILFLSKKYQILNGKIEIKTAPLFHFLGFLIPLGTIWSLQQIPQVILNRFASGMWQGTISALTISQGLMLVPTALVSQTVILSIFPSMARQMHAEPENVQETFFQTLRGAFFILIPFGFLLSALSRPVAVLFFSGKGVQWEGTLRIANSLACFGWAAFAYYADLFMTQSLITMRRTWPAIFLGIIRTVITYALSYFLTLAWDYRGLALSFSLGLVLTYFFLFPLMYQLMSFTGKWQEFQRYCLKLILASSPVLLLGWLLNSTMFRTGLHFSAVRILFEIAFYAAGGLAIYLFGLYCLKVREFFAVWERLKNLVLKRT